MVFLVLLHFGLIGLVCFFSLQLNKQLNFKCRYKMLIIIPFHLTLVLAIGRFTDYLHPMMI